ncbi:MAG: class II fumarate hydratase [archaeon]
MKTERRKELDSMGEVYVPKDAYYGAQTQRAHENFSISGLRFHREFVRAIGVIKQSAARVNLRLGLLDQKVSLAIDEAAQEVMDGKLDDEFVVDIFQTGSGTSTNMNANEVIANRAAEILTGSRSDQRPIHPNDHVNMCQSTNDVFPTAIHIAAVEAIGRKLLPQLHVLLDAFSEKSKEFAEVVKSGRTHLQDAVPLTLGQEFSAYQSMIEHSIARINSASDGLLEVPLGGTAVGTGLNAHARFAELVIQEINRVTGFPFRQADNLFEAMQSREAVVFASGSLKALASALMKIANDLRLMTSGLRTGLAEIDLPAMQPGSSIMPGKVNPVIPEAVNMVAAQVIGNDTTITIAGQAGQLELNTMMPVMAYNLLQSILILASASGGLAEKCIRGISADGEKCREYAERSLALVTAISPVVGYDVAARIFKRALKDQVSIREAARLETNLSSEELDEIMDLLQLTKGGLPEKKDRK